MRIMMKIKCDDLKNPLRLNDWRKGFFIIQILNRGKLRFVPGYLIKKSAEYLCEKLIN